MPELYSATRDEKVIYHMNLNMGLRVPPIEQAVGDFLGLITYHAYVATLFMIFNY